MSKTKKIITIAGKPGSGKSSTSKGLASALSYQHFSSGDLFRVIGKEHGYDDVGEINLAAERGELNIDELVDNRLQQIGKTEDCLVIDSRTAWHWIPESFKVYLDLDLVTAAKRILTSIDDFRKEHEFIADDPAQYALLLEGRLASESRRYDSLYGINPYDTSNYDLVVDSASMNIDQVISCIEMNYKEWLVDTQSQSSTH